MLFTAAQLTNLLVPAFFPNVSAADLAAKRSILNKTIASYCSATGCGVPPPDRQTVAIDLVNRVNFLQPSSVLRLVDVQATNE